MDRTATAAAARGVGSQLTASISNTAQGGEQLAIRVHPLLRGAARRQFCTCASPRLWQQKRTTHTLLRSTVQFINVLWTPTATSKSPPPPLMPPPLLFSKSTQRLCRINSALVLQKVVLIWPFAPAAAAAAGGGGGGTILLRLAATAII